MDDWNTTNMNCSDIFTCIECGKRFDEEESPYICFCSDRCKRISMYRTWGKPGILKIGDMQRKIDDTDEGVIMNKINDDFGDFDIGKLNKNFGDFDIDKLGEMGNISGLNELNDMLENSIRKTGSDLFLSNLSYFIMIRVAATGKISDICSLKKVADNEGELSIEDVEKILPYLEVIEKCSNIIDKAQVESIRNDGG